MNRGGEKRVGAGREKALSFTKITKEIKRINNIGELIIVTCIGKSMEKVTCVWKIKLSWPWTFDNASCRFRVISNLYWQSNSEVFVDVWLFLDKSIGEFSMLYKKCVPWCGLGRPEIHSMFHYSLLFQLNASLTKCRILIGSQQPLFILNLDDAAVFISCQY